MADGYVYFLVDRDAPAFKIGVSIRPTKRSQALRQRIDFEQSYQLRFEAREAYKCEQALHFLFRAHAYQRAKCDGYSEWFKIGVFAEVQRLMMLNKHLFGWKSTHRVKAPSEVGAPADRPPANPRFANVSQPKRAQYLAMVKPANDLDEIETVLADLAASKKLGRVNLNRRRPLA